MSILRNENKLLNKLLFERPPYQKRISNFKVAHQLSISHDVKQVQHYSIIR